MNPVWQEHCPPVSFRPIAQSASLTEALSALGQFGVRVIALGETREFPDFADFRLPEVMFSRRVMLTLDGVSVVYAQSICTPDSPWRDILHCGNESLGKRLFSGSLSDLTRSPLQYRQIENILARRSWFEWQGARLYLVEHFLPEIMRFQAA